MLRVKQLSKEDIAFAVEITDTMNWNLTEQDFKFIMDLEPKGCFVLFHDSERIGIATAISFGKVGWIGNVIVDEKFRRKGAGSMLVNHAVNYLKDQGAETVGVYSYKNLVDFYTRLGFKSESEFKVLRGKAFPSKVKEPVSGQIREGDLPKIIDFDASYFGASRKKLLEKIAAAKGNLCCHYVEKGEILGYAMAKVYNHYAEIGPLVCSRKNPEVAEALLKVVLAKLNGLEVSLCISKRERKLIRMLLEAGLAEEFDVVRMFYGTLGFKDCVYIAESLERG